MDNWDAFTLYRVDNYISVLDRRSLVQEEDVTTLHRRLHAATQNDNDWTLSPKTKFEYVPNHDSRHDDDAEAEALIEHLTSVTGVISVSLEMKSFNSRVHIHSDSTMN